MQLILQSFEGAGLAALRYEGLVGTDFQFHHKGLCFTNLKFKIQRLGIQVFMYSLNYLIIKNVFLRFANLDFFSPYILTERMSKHDAANPQSRILGKRASQAFICLCIMHTFTPISNIFLSGKFQGQGWGKDGLLLHSSFPLSGAKC